MYHIPVLLHETVDGLNIQPGGIYVDVTFGGGGHSREILRRLDTKAHLYSFDQDADAEQNIPQGDERFTFVRSNFRYLKNWMRYYGVEHIDGLLADLGVSSHHFDDEERGFSFRFDAPLDMRMNERAGTTAADIVNRYSEEQLADVFYLYGEMKTADDWPQPLSKHALHMLCRPSMTYYKWSSPSCRAREKRRTSPEYFKHYASRSTTKWMPYVKCSKLRSQCSVRAVGSLC